MYTLPSCKWSNQRFKYVLASRAIFVWPWNENTHEQNRNKWTEIDRFHLFIGRIQTRVAFGEKRHARQLSRKQPILRFDVILQHDWPIEQCLFHIRVFFGGKTCFDLFIHWLIKQITNSYRNHFSRQKHVWFSSRSYENRSISITLTLL